MLNTSRRDRYLAITQFLRDRYTDAGRLCIAIGGQPSRYSRLERMAAARYLGI